MKKIRYLLVFAIIIMANIYLSANQRKSENDLSLLSLFSINSAVAEVTHTATYDCYDEEYYDEQNWWNNRLHKRVCVAPGCGKKYISNSTSFDMATCTVSYDN